MSYWGAQVIVSLFGTFPVIGDSLVEWIRGDYFISDITLNRFFALHVVALPLVLIFLVVAHILALHEVGSSNPDGIDVKKIRAPDGTRLDSVAMHPYYTVKDLFGLSVFLVIFAAIVFFAPEMGGLFLEAPNFEPANPLLTPRTSRRCGTSPRTTPSSVRSRRSPAPRSGACSRCSRPCCSCSSCRGWTAGPCAPSATAARSSRPR
jgi:quinol-cytochrome oxidoreductase complex cytochrome b subunit